MAEGESGTPDGGRNRPLIDGDQEMVNNQSESVIRAFFIKMYVMFGNPMTPELQNFLSDSQRFVLIEDPKKNTKSRFFET